VRTSRVVIAIVLALVGGLWLGQGVGLIPGSFMTDSQTWALIGAVVVGLGLGLLLREWRLR
jgi:hypothetical protein